MACRMRLTKSWRRGICWVAVIGLSGICYKLAWIVACQLAPIGNCFSDITDDAFDKLVRAVNSDLVAPRNVTFFNFAVDRQLIKNTLLAPLPQTGFAVCLPDVSAARNPVDLLRRRMSHEIFCGRRVQVLNRDYFRFSNIVLDLSRVFMPYGSTLYAPMEQYKFGRGAFRQTCPKADFYAHQYVLFQNPWFDIFNKDYRYNWLHAFELTRSKQPAVISYTGTAVLHSRVEYQNLWHTMAEVYGVFLTLRLMKAPLDESRLFLLDNRTPSGLDELWMKMFGGRVINLGSAPPVNISFERLIWSSLGRKSLLHLFHCPHAPLLPDFRATVLRSFHVNDNHQLDCRQPVLTINVRRASDHWSAVGRRIKNWPAIIARLKSVFDGEGLNIVVADMQRASLQEQFQIHANTDILLGMHGAGLTNAMFMKNTSALIEIRPYWFRSVESFNYLFFESLSKWLRLRYFAWTNTDASQEEGGTFTTVPPDIIVELVKAALNSICPPGNGR